ncbi:MAG TPA: S41 family peptidase, partial [Candidatus Eremiobacteraeota bacterium]|nr:S41 family peptidase [Candidatus Eremiobacteraeota bacterium]
ESMSGGNFTGVGIYIELDREVDNQLTVVEPIEGTPGYEAGLKSGDWIIKIDGKSTKGVNLDNAVTQIRGPEGSIVTLTIQRKGVDEPIEFKIKRAFIHVSTVVSKIVNENVGYIKLRLFGSETNREIDQAMTDLEKKGAKAFILDLRNNGGGYVTAAVDVSSKFLKEGEDIVSIKDRFGGKNRYKSYGTVHELFPLVILVNNFSASASEITAGAVRDGKRGILLGTKTFGKGSVQTIYPLDKGGAIKITTAHYFTPRGRNINEKGLKPDIIVEMDDDLIGTDKDIQMEEAVKYLQEQIAKKNS